MATEFSENSEKKQPNYLCEKCDYKCSKRQHFTQHCLTKKHQNRLGNHVENSGNTVATEKKYTCKCGKYYNDRTGLWKHHRQSPSCLENTECIVISNKPNNKPSNDTIIDLFKESLNENKEIRMLMAEQQKQLIDQNNKLIEMSKNQTMLHYNNTNNINNRFNLNVFLNEQCKDALNMSEFISSLEIQLNDLENTGKLGFVEGISKIFVRGLKQLDTCKRPIHCSDLKREVIYVKDENKWEREDEDKQKIQMAIKQLTSKNIKQIPKWIEHNPQYKDISSKKNDEYMHLVSNCMLGDSIEEQCENINKVIKNVVKEVVIDK